MEDIEILNVADISSLPKLSIRGSIAPKGFMMFGDEVVFSASDCAKFLEDNKDAPKIVVEISSPGGFVSEGFEIYDLLVASGKDITTIGYSVNSIAVVPFLAGKKRYVSENVQFIIHNSRIDPMMLGAPLTSEDLSRLAEETNQTDMKILNLYCNVLGEDNRSKLLALMGADTDLTAKGAIKYGFANGYWAKKSEGKSAKNLCIESLAINLIQKMETEKLSALEAGMKTLQNMVKKFIKNSMDKMKNDVTLELKDGKKVYVYSDTEDLVGKSVVLVGEDGMPTEDPAPDGDHELSDGRVVVVAAGIVTEVKEAVDLTALQEELKNSKEEVEKLKNQLATEATAKNELATQVTNLVKEFNEFKKSIPGDPDKNKDKDKAGDKITVEQYNKMSTSQKLYATRTGKF